MVGKRLKAYKKKISGLEQEEIELDKMMHMVTVLNDQFTTSYAAERSGEEDDGYTSTLVPKRSRGRRLKGSNEDNYHSNASNYMHVTLNDAKKITHHNDCAVIGINPPHGSFMELSDKDEEDDSHCTSISESTTWNGMGYAWHFWANSGRDRGVSETVFVLAYGPKPTLFKAAIWT